MHTYGICSTHILVITANHFSIRHLMAKTVGGLVGVNRHVKYICGLLSTH